MPFKMKPLTEYDVHIEWPHRLALNAFNESYESMYLSFKNKKSAYRAAKLARSLKKGIRASVSKYTEY